MLKTAFIGNRNTFDECICQWLSEHTELSLVVWTNKLAWSHGGTGRQRRIASRFARRARRTGYLRAINEMGYYAAYRRLLQRREQTRINAAIDALQCRPRRPLADIPQVYPENIKSAELHQHIESLQLDAMFAMCIDVYLPRTLIDLPRFGSFLWHEGITPEYRGVYSPFWALANRDYDKLGYTLLRMNAKLDAGEIFVQGPAADVDPMKSWHGYIGHKAILDSLPDVKRFLEELEAGTAQPLFRPGASDGYYSYPTLTALLRIMAHRSLSALRLAPISISASSCPGTSAHV